MGDRKWIEVVDHGMAPGSAPNGGLRVVRTLDPNSGRERNAIVVPRFALRDAPDSERVAELERELKVFREVGEVLAKQRDDARHDVEELEARNYALYDEAKKSHAAEGEMLGRVKRLESERDEARQRATDLECELERVRLELSEWKEAECKRLADELETIPRDEPERPVPQTHFRAGDLIGETHPSGPCRLVRFHGFEHGLVHSLERWSIEGFPDTAEPSPYFRVGHDVILERDGIPTDAGLKRLAEKAGYKFGISSPEASSYRAYLASDRVWVGEAVTDRERLALAAALRAMGGA